MSKRPNKPAHIIGTTMFLDGVPYTVVGVHWNRRTRQWWAEIVVRNSQGVGVVSLPWIALSKIDGVRATKLEANQ